uniref:Uncharacterized protein n=1 Tax=Chenopodium quinoa TaxID=63459 RepID=A0A803LJ44_CHEQI
MSSFSIQRQLQQLFQLHDSGLDQAFIDALPVFQYKEIVGLKEPFDCAVCLCEFTEQDKLRGALYTPGVAIENPVFDFDDSRDEEKGVEIEVVEVQDQLHVLERGKINDRNSNVGETSSSNLDARRCFSMGSYQYVVADSVFQVALCPKNPSNEGAELKMIKGKNGNLTADHNFGDAEARKINIGSKTESLSVSKIWLWSKKGKSTNSSNTEFSGFSVDNSMNLPWTHKGQAT